MSKYEQPLMQLWNGIRSLSTSKSIEERLGGAYDGLIAASSLINPKNTSVPAEIKDQYSQLVEAFAVHGGKGGPDHASIMGKLTSDGFDKIADMYLSLYYSLKREDT